MFFNILYREPILRIDPQHPQQEILERFLYLGGDREFTGTDVLEQPVDVIAFERVYPCRNVVPAIERNRWIHRTACGRYICVTYSVTPALHISTL